MQISDSDPYLEITKRADDKTILKMLSVNRKYNRPEFFQKIFITRYPLLIKYKNQFDSWKNYYLRTIKYISKLKEKYNFPYIPNPNFNPEKIYLDSFSINNRQDLYRKGLIYSSEIGDINLVEYFLLKTNYELMHVLKNAARYGKIELIKYIIEKYGKNQNDLQEAAYYAVLYDQLETYQYLLNNGAYFEIIHLDTVRNRGNHVFEDFLLKYISENNLTI